MPNQRTSKTRKLSGTEFVNRLLSLGTPNTAAALKWDCRSDPQQATKTIIPSGAFYLYQLSSATNIWRLPQHILHLPSCINISKSLSNST